MALKGIDARRAAVQILQRVLQDKDMLSVAMNEASGIFDGMAGPDRARATSLSLKVLRNLSRLDGVLDKLIDRRPPQGVMMILRVCAVEILLDEIAPHGAVGAAVSLAKSRGRTAKFAGMVNAVGRKLDTEGREIFAARPLQKLPKTFRGPLARHYSEDVIKAMEAAFVAGAPVDLSLRDPSEAQIRAEALGAEVMPNGSLRLPTGRQVSAMDGFDEGAWWVQDAAATSAAHALGDIAGKRVLDMCAAPGGKSLQLAAKGADVTALDSSEERLSRVYENLDRTKLKANVVCADALLWTAPEPFDAILIDAPCSASGTIRRHPDLPFIKRDLQLKELVGLQRRMIARAVTQLKPGGELIYATCSLFAREGEDQANHAAEHIAGLQIIPIDAEELGYPAEARTSEGFLRLRPDFWADKGGMDGFFVAKFRYQP